VVQHSRIVRRPAAFLLSISIALFVPGKVFAAPDAGTPASAADAADVQVDGSLSFRYISRSSDTGSARLRDQDAYADLRLDVAQPAAGRHEFHLNGTLRSDLDGDQDPHTFSPLEDIGDAHARRTVGTVYEAYYALNNPFRSLTQVRAGRQAGTRDEPVYFDGIAADLGTDRLNVTVYGGAAIHFSEVGRHWGNDTVEGAGIDYTPLPGLGLSADWLAVADEWESDPGGGTAKDRILAFKVRQRLASSVHYSVKYRLLDGDPKDLSVTAQAASPAWDAEASAHYVRQFRVQDELSTDLAPFTEVIGRSAPFQSVDLKVRKTVADRVSIDAGYFIRTLLHPADEGPFNKEYSRSFLAADIADLFFPGLSWSLTAERWDAKETGTNTYGTDLAYRVKRRGREARLGIGTYYSLYKYDYYTELGVRDKVRTYYLDAKYPFGRSFSLNGRYEFERGIEEYQTMRLGMRYDF
jgi:hypothetical protein